jgi:hypothetical protein
VKYCSHLRGGLYGTCGIFGFARLGFGAGTGTFNGLRAGFGGGLTVGLRGLTDRSGTTGGLGGGGTCLASRRKDGLKDIFVVWKSPGKSWRCMSN